MNKDKDYDRKRKELMQQEEDMIRDLRAKRNRLIDEAEQEYQYQRSILRKETDKQLEILKVEQAIDDLFNNKVVITNLCETPMHIYDDRSDKLLATFIGYTGPPSNSHNTWARKKVLNHMVKHVVHEITMQAPSIITRAYDEKYVDVEFSQCEHQCQKRRFIYRDDNGKILHVYFDQIFQNEGSRRILTQRLEAIFPSLKIQIQSNGFRFSSC